MTSEQEEIFQERCDLYSDMHKDAWGFRPRVEWEHMRDWSDSKWEACFAGFQARIKEDQEFRAQVQSFKVDTLHKRLRMLIESGADNVLVALRWLHQAHDTNGDDEYLDWQLGVPYGHCAKLRRLEVTL